PGVGVGGSTGTRSPAAVKADGKKKSKKDKVPHKSRYYAGKYGLDLEDVPVSARGFRAVLPMYGLDYGYGYELGVGVGGSTGTRSPATLKVDGKKKSKKDKVPHKSRYYAGKYGLDLEDVPVSARGFRAVLPMYGLDYGYGYGYEPSLHYGYEFGVGVGGSTGRRTARKKTERGPRYR
ncbi:hypothetical protein K490DRAFT_69043, partial [Saccharata proteae CBS 121410]